MTNPEHRTTERRPGDRPPITQPDPTLKERRISPQWLWIVGIVAVAAILITLLAPSDTQQNASVDTPAQTGQTTSPQTGARTNANAPTTQPAEPQTETTGSTGNANTGGTDAGGTGGTPAQQ